MSLELSGTTGVKGVAGSVSAPSIVGDDTNTGISFPSADTIKFSTGGVERMSITNSGVSGAGKILQVVSTTKTDVTSQYTGPGSYWDTGLTAQITPSSTSNKIFIIGYVMVAIPGPQHNIGVSINRGGTIIDGYLGDADGGRRRIGAGGTNMVQTYDNFVGQINFQYLDTASSTSAITFGVSIRNPSSSSRTIYMNRASTDTDSSNHYRTASTITVMEVSA